MNTLLAGENNIELNTSGWKCNYFINRLPASSKVVILLPSAQSLLRRRPVYFSRHSWYPNFNCNVIAVSDPTLQLNKDLLGGWFQGLHCNYVLPIIVSHLELILQNLSSGWKDVCFIGSSMGGFAAMQMVIIKPEARAIVEMPQIDLRKYSDKHINLLSKTCYGKEKITDVDDKFSHRLSVIEHINREKKCGKIFYIQKTHDSHHYKEHYLPFVQFIHSCVSVIHRSNFIFEEINVRQESEKSAHSPLSQKELLERFNFFTEV